eukprot:c9661_g1_i1.p1 GENE.c9661_g1_i1~~c9661_g1_i1.p1  ORF type:complete len:701 (-),score=185.64 c9661_g1_i1:101-2173(-)
MSVVRTDPLGDSSFDLDGNRTPRDEKGDASDIISKAKRSALVTVDESEVRTLARKAMNFEHSSGSFTIDDLTSLLAHFKTVDRVTADGTLSKNEFVKAFEMLGVTGFFVDVLFDAFTWDDSMSLTHLNIRDFMCGFTLLTMGKADDKLSIAFSLYDELTGKCPIARIQDILRCMHLVLGRVLASSSEIPSDRDEFITVMMENIHSVASVEGRPVKEVTLVQLIAAAKRFPKFYACMDSMKEEKNSLNHRLRVNSGHDVLDLRTKFYLRAGLTGMRRIFFCFPGEHQSTFDDSSARLTNHDDDAPVAVPGSPGGKEALLDVALGRDSWHTMLSFILGVRRSIERLTALPPDLTSESYKQSVTLQVPCHNPAAINAPRTLSMIDYCPTVFQHIRRLYNIDDKDFVRSLSPTPILGNLLLGNLKRLSTLVSEGKSGSLLYFSEDGRYVIKTIAQREHDTFLNVLQHYVDYIRSNPHTLIIRFLGLFDMNLINGRKLCFVIMANVFETKLSIHRRYDLKGSTVGRSALKGDTPSHLIANVALKDNDLDFKFLLPQQLRRDLVVQIASDAQWLATYELMDYSLLIGVNFMDKDAEQIKRVKRRDEVWKWRSRFQQHFGGLKCSLSRDKENCVIFVGIIDTFTHYDYRKRFERYAKVMSGVSRTGVSVMPPQAYAQRFINFACENVFGEVQRIAPE